MKDVDATAGEAAPRDESPWSRARLVRPRNGFIAAALFALLFVVYHANWSVMDEGDAVPSATLPYALLSTGGLSFDPDHFPELFKWKSIRPFPVLDDFFFVSYDDYFIDRTTREWRESGHLELNGPRYYVVESKKRHTFVSTFGPIPGLMLLPIAALFYWIDPKIAYNLPLKTSIAKLGSASMVAACAALIFAIASRRTSRLRAVLLALTYGLGTCAWAVSSQNLWQQTVDQLFLTAGGYFLLCHPTRRAGAIAAGFFLGAAMACRATGVVALAGAFVHLAVHHRKSAVPFVLGALPVPLLLLGYNFYYFGTPFALAQEMIGHEIARQKTGSPALWQTPFLDGALGLLLSPSRGLLVFSPLIATSFVGMVLSFTRPRFHDLRPLAGAALFMMALQCKWFDWWGGWTYGYRPWLDAIPYAVLLMLPVIEPLTKTVARRAAYALLLTWSIAVQALGALTYDRSWNIRRIFVVRVPEESGPRAFMEEPEAIEYARNRGGEYLGPSLCDIDLPYCRYRLWSLQDNAILYFFTHFAETHARRLPPAWDTLGKSGISHRVL